MFTSLFSYILTPLKIIMYISRKLTKMFKSKISHKIKFYISILLLAFHVSFYDNEICTLSTLLPLRIERIMIIPPLNHRKWNHSINLIATMPDYVFC